MADQFYITRQNDELDYICWRYYGFTARSVETVLLANPNLAEFLPLLPAGLRIKLPELSAPSTTTVLRIWD